MSWRTSDADRPHARPAILRTPRHLDALDRDVETVPFCNGPACAATPQAIRELLDAGHPAATLLDHRGGLHGWLTLGFPAVTD